MKVNAILPPVTAFAAAVVSVNLLIAPKISAQAIVPAQVTTGVTAEVERVTVTGSNIPTAEETGPNPVDTYRTADIEKLGIRNATDFTTFLPQQSGGTTNLNMATGDGTVQFNLRGLLSKETLVLVDGKRVALGSLNAVGFSGGVDINLIPFPMIDHIDILKDGASAVYGSDAIAGVVNFFLIHKFRGLEIAGNYGNTNLGASLRISGNALAGSSVATGTCRRTRFTSPGEDSTVAARVNAAALEGSPGAAYSRACFSAQAARRHLG
jgi:outer membrane receptor protein involved in Fe transport